MSRDSFYWGVRWVGRFWLWFFFRDVAVVRASLVPASGPVLLCINHPNNLIDSLLVGGVLPRKVHYLATAALFRNPLVARFLAACGAIPVYRKQDDPGKMDRNADAFAACFRALERGRLVGIYPEGTTHSESRIQRIKTGAARIALDYQASGRGAPLTLIPVGITFEARKAFRGPVRLSFGEPIALAPYAPVYRDEPAKAVEALTTAIQWGMEAEILNVGRLERQDLVRAVEEIYRSDLIRELQEERRLGTRQIDPLRLSRAIADAAAHFEERDPERVARMWAAVLKYRAMLAA
jgi:glycerol-3-phosphate O-acyltransferase/dihydroxyacetone phosphate acyltransferase